MSAANKALVRRAFDEVLLGKLDVVDEIVARDVVRHDLGGGPDIVGPESIKRFIAGLRAAFPDLESTVEDVMAEGNSVVVRYTAHATHKGPFQGAAPTGKRVVWSGVNIYEVANGKIVETWQISDNLGLLRQIGALPS